MDRKPTAKNWSVNDYDDLLAGVRDAGELRTLDHRGMTPGLAAALDTGSASHRLMSLLDGPEAGEGESALSRIEELLGEQVEQGRLVLEKLDAVIRLLSPSAFREAEAPQSATAAVVEGSPTPPTGRGQGSRGTFPHALSLRETRVKAETPRTRQPAAHPLGG